MSTNRRYTSEEVSGIVRRALEGKGGQDDVSHEDLLEIARQSGISTARVEAAIEEEERLGSLEKARELWLRRRRGEFFAHLRAFLIVNGFLLLINLFTTPFGAMWVQWPILGWGIGLTFHASSAFYPSERDVERGAHKILRKREARRAEATYD